MPYTREQIQANWTELRQRIENAGININTAGQSDRNGEITRLQALLRRFFADVISTQHEDVVEAGDEVFSDGSHHAELMNFRNGATFNGRYYANKAEFLDAQSRPGEWAEDAFLSAGFAALGIQPIYHYAGQFQVNPQGEAPFTIREAVLVARLNNRGNGHWVYENHENAGGGDCGLYSAAQAVTSIWDRMMAWLNGGAAPFASTAPALQNIKTRARKDWEEQQGYQAVVRQYKDHSLKALAQLYMSLVDADHEDEYLVDAIVRERAENSGGMPMRIQEGLRALVTPPVQDPADMTAQRQAELHPYLLNIIAQYLKRDPAVLQQVSNNPGNPVKSPVTFTAPVVPPAPDAAQLRFNDAVKLLKSNNFELEPLQAIYEEASSLFKFTHDTANNTEEKIIKALANECKAYPAFFDRLNFFLTPVKSPKAAL